MASRSTRRNIKNSEIPKMDKCQNDEDSADGKEVEMGKRRSLRLSPKGSSSTSPPRKTRRLKAIPSSSENRNSESDISLSKCTIANSNVSIETSSSIFEEDCTSELENANPTTPKRTTRNTSLFPTSNARCTRNASISVKSTNVPLHDIDVETSSRRTTRSKMYYPSTDIELGGKFRKGQNAVIFSEVHNNSQVPSTSQGTRSSKKRSLPASPEPSSPNDSLKQTPNRSSKRKCKSPAKQPTAKALDASTSESVSFSDSPLLISGADSALINGALNSASLYDNSSENTSSVKRRFSILLEDEDTSSSKRCKIISQSSSAKGEMGKADDSSVGSSDTLLSQPGESFNLMEKSDAAVIEEKSDAAAIEEKSDATAIKEKSDATAIKEKSDATAIKEKSDATAIKEKSDATAIKEKSDAAAILIRGLGLTEEQCIEIYNIIPPEAKDRSNVEIIELLVEKLLREFTSFTSMHAPRFNKMLRQLLVNYCNCETTVEKKHKLCETALEWSQERKTVNLRHELELALMTLYYNTGFYRKAEETASGLFKETKKLQDKEKTVKACLCLSKSYHAMGNIAKARANITSAKTEALKIYAPPDLQAELDLQSGIMQVAEEKDMETAFSYFKEAAMGFSEKKNRAKALKYILLTKLLINKPEEGEKAVRNQSHVEDIDEGVEAMLCITKAAMSCSLADFKTARTVYKKELEEDLVVNSVLDQLYGKLLEKNLLNIITPYEKMQISVIAERIGLARDEVERRLSQMILDGEIRAQLDHRDDCLYVYQPEAEDKVYKHGLDSISQIDRTLSLLNRKVKQLL